MRTKTIAIYQFDELPTEAAKERARGWYREGALDYDWWDCIYQDAETIGLKITSFDLDRSRHANGHLTMSLVESCKAILKEHGEACETYKTSSEYLTKYNRLDNAKDEAIRALSFQDFENGKETDLGDQFETDVEALTEEYQQQLLEDYSLMLQHEYEWLLADEQVEESIRANAYEFTEEGERA